MATEHAKALLDEPNFELCGVFSRTQTSAQEFAIKFGIKSISESISELYNNSTPDLVVIAVPELELLSICKETFHYPWVHFIEKPVGHNYAEAAYLAKIATELNARVFVALNRRFYSSTHTLKAAIDLEIGPKNFVVVDQESSLKALKAGQPELVVQNWMFANSIHMIDLLRYLANGEIVNINNYKQEISADVWNITSNIQFSSGDIATYVGIWNSPGPWSLNCFTGNSRWELRPIEQAHFQLSDEFKTTEVPIDIWDQQFKPGVRRMADELLKYFKFGKTELPTIHVALDSMKSVQQIYGGINN